jgi:hypothetical protein
MAITGRPVGSKNNPAQSAMHPNLRMTWKRAMKLEKVARLVADPAGYSNEQIANHLKCSAQTIVLIKQMPAFHAKMIEVMSGVTSEYDEDLRSETENAREELKSMLPSSMMVIRNALLSKNENVRVKAAFEVLDREGTMAKVSKSSVSVTTVPDVTADPTIQNNIMQLLAQAPLINPSGPEAISMSGGFTQSAAAAGKQQIALDEVGEELLEELDIQTKPN